MDMLSLCRKKVTNIKRSETSSPMRRSARIAKLSKQSTTSTGGSSCSKKNNRRQAINTQTSPTTNSFPAISGAKDGSIIIKVLLKSDEKQCFVTGIDTSVVVSLSGATEDGQDDTGLVEYFAMLLGVPKGDILIEKASRFRLVRIIKSELTADKVRALLTQEIGRKIAVIE